MSDLKVLVIGSGISGLTTAIRLCEKGIKVILVSPYPSERSQSIMAAGGINASINSNDSYLNHKEDTLKGGCFIESSETLEGFCKEAPECIKWLDSLGVIFTRDENQDIALRALGGHSNKRTVFSGTSTGKQIVSALVRKCIEYETLGLLERKLNLYFYSALINNNKCYGALFYDSIKEELITIKSDYTVMATGGQNKLYGKTTGSELCDGYATGKLFTQGVFLRNLEFIQYHPTSIETEHKRMLISEGARGEGGRLFYFDGDKKVYFMEELYGPNGNLMPRDIVSREIYKIEQTKQVYLDITFLSKDVILNKLGEIYDICKHYLNIDCTKEYIPVDPCIHFFMGGIKVNNNHETNINNLYAVGECASKYHGANRLGGNSLMAAVYSGTIAAGDICNKTNINNIDNIDFNDYTNQEKEYLEKLKHTTSLFPSIYLQKDIASIMNNNLGIVRSETNLLNGLKDLEFYLKTVESIKLDPTISIYQNYRIKYMIILSIATMKAALERKESRGAHYRIDYPNTLDEYKKISVVRYNNGNISINFEEDI